MNQISSVQSAQTCAHKPASDNAIKCVVWDLDNTLWHGVLSEDSKVTLRRNMPEIIKSLDRRGILQSIASKNDHDLAMAKLEEFGLDEYFLYPQINWDPKSSAVAAIAQAINIGIDTLAFIDDQPFEREEVKFSQPAVRCIDATQIDDLLEMPELQPRFITKDSEIRRRMYQSDIRRNGVENQFSGTKEEFLATLGMSFKMAPAGEEDLKRAEELTVRTHQLNTTGYTYSYQELDFFRTSPNHKLLVASLDDKYGTYGKIGLTLLECNQEAWTIKLLLMSCRVMSRGVGSIMINYLRLETRNKGLRLLAEIIPNERNRMMYITYKFAQFKEIEKQGDLVILENDQSQIQDYPDYVKVEISS
ncbi:MAG: HAD-IIIC family phosphatase [Proteobacteria bacterium]|nr:HAD-IIIC family phosphatase [Pseudomonadota bacterium]MBU1714995.1 HAD-IIIC family phosphatase [Pseudomonadota bacterium]